MKNHKIVAKLIESAMETHKGAAKENPREEEIANEVLIQTVKYALKKTESIGEKILLRTLFMGHLSILSGFIWILIEIKRVLLS